MGVVRILAVIAFAIAGLLPATGQDQAAFLRISGVGAPVASGVSTTSPDGVTVSIPSDVHVMRKDVFGMTPAPTVTGTTGTRTFSLGSGTLPPGITVNPATGNAGGTPTEVGEWPGIVVDVVDGQGRRGSTPAYTIRVLDAPALHYGDRVLSLAKRATIVPQVSGIGDSPRYAMASGSVLPRGLVINRNTGIISGTPLFLGPSPALRVTVSDANGGSAVSAPFTIEIVEGGTITVPTPLQLKVGLDADVQPTITSMTDPVEWSLADGTVLPAGVELDPATGRLHGAPTTEGTYRDLQLLAVDTHDKPAASNPFTVEVVRFTVAYGTPSGFTVNTPVSLPPTLAHAAEPVEFTLHEGELPAGFTLDPETGVIAGSTPDRGTYPGIVVRAVGADGVEALSPAFSLSVVAPSVSYDDAGVDMDAPLSLDPEVVDLAVPVLFELAEGELPEGLSLDKDTGRISGSTSMTGDWPLVVRATDDNAVAVLSDTFTISVGVPDIGTNNPDGRARVGLPYYQGPASNGLAAPVTWVSTGEALPDGMELDPVTGAISGTPTRAAVFAGIVLEATDANGVTTATDAFTIEVVEPVIIYGQPIRLEPGVAASVVPTVTDLEPGGTFVHDGGVLPPGLTVDNATGTISGTPTATGTWSGITVLGVDAGGAFPSNTFSVIVGDDTGAAVIGVRDYEARTGVSFLSDTPSVDGISGPFTWSVASGTLPDGLAVNASTGVISGIPALPGTWSGITLRAVAGGGEAVSQPFSITVTTMSVVADDVYYGRLGRALEVQPTVLGAVGAVTWELLDATVPSGTAFDGATGAISGTPTVVGPHGPYRVRATDSLGTTAASEPFTVEVRAALEPDNGITLDMPGILRGRISVDFWFQPVAEGATGTVTWSSVGGPLPPGITLNTATGRISGQPTSVGFFEDIRLHAADSSGKSGTTPAFSIAVHQVPRVTVDPLHYDGDTRTRMTITPTHDTEVFGSRFWSLEGKPPFGLRIDPATGVLSGKPEQAGEFGPLRIVLEDADGAVGKSQPFTITVTSVLVATPAPPNTEGPGEDDDIPVVGVDPGGVTGTTYGTRVGRAFASPRPSVTGNAGDVTWSLAQGTLPPGLAVDSSSGRIYGTTTRPGLYAGIYLRASDPAGGSSVAMGPVNIYVADIITVTHPANFTVRVGKQLSFAPHVRGIVGSAYWTMHEAGLPAGLRIDPRMGFVSASPTSPITVSGVSFTATDTMDGASGTSAGATIRVLEPIAVGAPSVPSGVAGSPFEMAGPHASGIYGDATWYLDGAGKLPAGLSLDRATGAITGTPLEGGSRTLRLRVYDSIDRSNALSPPFTLVIGYPPNPRPNNPDPGAPPPVTVPLQLAYGTSFTAYTEDRFSSGGPVVYGYKGPESVDTYSLAPQSAPLPGWAALDPRTGWITGTPTASGNHDGIVVRLERDGDTADSEPFRILVHPFQVSAPATALSGRVGQEAEWRASAHVPKGSVSWSIASGSLPSGLTLDSKGLITGTPTAIAKDSPVTLRATDSASRTDTSERFTITVTPTLHVPSTVYGRVGTPLAAFTPRLSGATGTVNWTLDGTLPAWASFDAATGRITGTPTAVGTARNLVLRGTHAATGLSAASSPFSIEVSLTPLSMADQPESVVIRLGESVTMPQPTVSGAVGTLAWSTVGNFPDWLAMSSTGRVSGTPTEATATDQLSIRARDPATGSSITSQGFTVRAVADPRASIPSSGIAKARSPFSMGPGASNIIGERTWEIVSGSLPGWATFDSRTGRISGTPQNGDLGTTGGLSLRVTDSHDGKSAVTGTFSITVEPSLVVSASSGTYTTHPGIPFASGMPGVTGQSGAVAWSLASGTVPPGTTLSPETGVVSGTPSATGTWSGLLLQATDVNTGATGVARQPFSVKVTDLTASAGALYRGTVTRRMTVTPTVANAIGGVTWELVGTLPAGLALDERTGVISGVPTEDGRVDGLQLRVTDSTGVSALTGTFSIDIVRGFSATIDPLAYEARVGVGFAAARPVASNAQGTPTWTVASGTLPDGVSLRSDTGVVSGVPSTAGSYSFTLRATDSVDGTEADTGEVTVNVGDVPTVTVNEAYTTRVDALFSVVPQLGRARQPTTWTLASGTKPDWAALNPQTGVLSGRPTATGVHEGLSLRARDADTATGVSRQFSVTVEPGITATVSQIEYAGRKGRALSTVAPTAGNILGSASWSVGSGSLPPGLTVNPSTGVVSGSPTSHGTYTARLMATDSHDGARAQTQLVTFAITDVLDITGEKELYGAHVGQAMSTPLMGVTGQRGTVTWSVGGGDMPDWVDVDPATGKMTGTPSAAGAAIGVRLRVTDTLDGATALSDPFTVQSLDPLVIDNMATNYTARLGRPWVAARPSVRNAAPPAVWTKGTGTFPTWMTVAPNGTMSGTADATGTSPVLTLRVQDDFGATRDSAGFRVNVRSAPTFLSYTRIHKWRVGATIGAPALAVTHDTATVDVPSFLMDGDVPPGLSYVSGRLSAAMPVALPPGDYAFTLGLRDGTDFAETWTDTIELGVRPALTVGGSAVTMSTRAGKPLSLPAFPASGVSGQPTWQATGSVPPGITVDRDDGSISGRPTTPSTYAFQARLTDSWDNASVLSPRVTLSVTAGTTVATIPDQAFRAGSHGTGAAPGVSMHIGGVTWTLNAGTLPDGLLVNPSTGAITGTPSAVTGPSAVTLMAVDSDGSAGLSNSFNVSVKGAFGASYNGDRPMALAADVYVQFPPATVNAIGPVTYELVGGTMPSGMALQQSSGIIYGTPRLGGEFQVTVRARDTFDQASVDIPVTIAVTMPPRGHEIFHADGIFYPPEGVTKFRVFTLGGGAAGGRRYGGGAQYRVGDIETTEPLDITVGVSGAPGTAGSMGFAGLRSYVSKLSEPYVDLLVANGGIEQGSPSPVPPSGTMKSVTITGGVSRSKEVKDLSSGSTSTCRIYKVGAAGGDAGLLINGSGPDIPRHSQAASPGTGYGAGGGGGYQITSKSGPQCEAPYSEKFYGTEGGQGIVIIEWGYTY